jgi:hypothetical protein
MLHCLILIKKGVCTKAHNVSHVPTVGRVDGLNTGFSVLGRAYRTDHLGSGMHRTTSPEEFYEREHIQVFFLVG